MIFLLFRSAVADSWLNSDIRIGANIGLMGYHIKDNIASPLIYRNTLIVPELHVSIAKNTLIHSFSASYYSGRLDCKVKRFNALTYAGSLKYSCLKRMRSLEKNSLQFTIGAFVQDQFAVSDYTVESSSASWYNFMSIGPQAQITVQPSADIKYTISATIPALTYAVRPYYSVYEFRQDETVYEFAKRNFGDGSFSSWTEFFSFSGEIQALKIASDGFEMKFGYRFNFIKHKKPRSLILYSNYVLMGFSF